MQYSGAPGELAFSPGMPYRRTQTLAMTRFLAFLFLASSLVFGEETPLTAISYSIRNDNAGDKEHKNWDDRKGTLAAYLLEHKASIIGLQEVKHKQLLDMDKALPNHTYVGVGRDDGKTAGEFSPIFYDRRIWKLDPKEHGTFWLSDTPDVIASRTWGHYHNRICTWARLIKIGDPKNESALYVYNTHWDHQSQPARVKSGALILKKVKTRSQQDHPYLVMGDFNATIENPAITQFLKSGLLLDHAKKKMKSSSHWKADLVPGLRIDHVFTAPSFKKATLQVDSNGDKQGNAASDHHPVRLQILQN
ncbi:endonuclease/exonuclease/phosphatase family protein [bacterium]|nr:endonuclease/exonuclease/phosphatase family protein [bacterium]